MSFHFFASVFFVGFGAGLSLIIAIGAQNAFVLKQGILKNHPFAIAALCTFIDSILIIAGVSGLGELFGLNPFLLLFARAGGAAFLLYYGFCSLQAVFKNEILDVHHGRMKLSLRKSISITLALSLLNPHVYLDTCILLGSIAGQFSFSERPSFILGAIIASFVWFFSLSYGARYLYPLFKNPLSWKILDSLICMIMWLIASSLIWGILQQWR